MPWQHGARHSQPWRKATPKNIRSLHTGVKSRSFPTGTLQSRPIYFNKAPLQGESTKLVARSQGTKPLGLAPSQFKNQKSQPRASARAGSGRLRNQLGEEQGSSQLLQMLLAV